MWERLPPPLSGGHPPSPRRSLAPVALPEWLNIAEVFLTRRLTEGRGDRVALRLADRRFSYADLDALANRFGNLLLDLGVRQEERVVLSLPKLYFGYATGSNLFFPLSVGGSAALFAEHPTAEVLFDQIARHRPTILINTPKMVAAMIDLARSPAGAGADLSSLRFATSAGEALPPSLYDRWKGTFGVELYDG